jgi:hypothetical protein
VLDLLPGPDGLTVEEARAVVLTAGTIGGTTASTFLERFQEHDDPAVRKPRALGTRPRQPGTEP